MIHFGSMYLMLLFTLYLDCNFIGGYNRNVEVLFLSQGIVHFLAIPTYYFKRAHPTKVELEVNSPLSSLHSHFGLGSLVS